MMWQYINKVSIQPHNCHILWANFPDHFSHFSLLKMHLDILYSLLTQYWRMTLTGFPISEHHALASSPLPFTFVISSC